MTKLGQVYESSESRTEHISIDGRTVTVTMIVPWAGTDAWNWWPSYQPGRTPRIGDIWYLSEGPEDICTLTDIKIDNLGGDNPHSAKVTLLYSSHGAAGRKDKPDDVMSWEESVTVSAADTKVDEFYDVDDLEKRNWAAWYLAYSDDKPTEGWPEGEDVTIPDLEMRKLTKTFTATVYGSACEVAALIERTGEVNNTLFLSRYLDIVAAAREIVGYDERGRPIYETKVRFQDTQKWMFSDVRMTRISPSTFRYDLQFDYNPLTWRDVVGFDIGNVNRPILYKETDLMTLFNGLDKINPDKAFGTGQ